MASVRIDPVRDPEYVSEILFCRIRSKNSVRIFQKSEPQSSGPREKLLISTSCTVRRICKNCFSNVRYQQPIIFDTDSKRQTRFGYGRTFTKLQRYL